MTMNYDTANQLLTTLLKNLRNDLFEPTDYSIIELCDMMLAFQDSDEDLIDGDPDILTPEECTQYALVTGLNVIYKTIEEFAPGHFEGSAFRYEVARLEGEG